MGTNFYMKGHRDDDDPRYHVGKRSAAGMYCWDCGLTLHKGGTERLHFTSWREHWHGRCPTCGQEPVEEFLKDGAAGRELGFNENPPERKTGVRSCASFSWAMEPTRINRWQWVQDEYGRVYTLAEFRQVLEECPIQFTHSLGVRFS